MDSVNIAQKLATFSDHWSPKIVGQVNDTHIKLAKFQGEFMWHKNEDEMFLVIKGKFTMRLRTGDIELKEGEFLIVPRGVEHMPVAEEEVQIMLIEPAGTLNTGNLVNEHTVQQPQTI